MKFGLSDKVINALISVFEEFPVVKKAIIFGSRAAGDQKPGSDIDLALSGALNFETLMKIKAKIEELNLPYNVDLHDYSKIKKLSLKNEIDESGRIFYANNKKSRS
mgnify:CR=1 FL=1